MQEKFCQSCGMPMGETDEMYGTAAKGGKSEDYCKYCFENGKFTYDGPMEGLIEICVPHWMSAESGLCEQEARRRMKQYFPTLKRWKA